jgi:hypothetical protein
MEELLKPIADFFNVDIATMWRSVVSGTSSTGIGIYVADASWNWRFEFNMVSLFWATVSCIILTVLSMFVQDCYRSVKKKIQDKKGK